MVLPENVEAVEGQVEAMRWKAESKEENIRARVPAIKTRTGTVMVREEDIKTQIEWFLSAAAKTTVKST